MGHKPRPGISATTYVILCMTPFATLWDTGEKYHQTLPLCSRYLHFEQKAKINMGQTVSVSRTQRLGGLFWEWLVFKVEESVARWREGFAATRSEKLRMPCFRVSAPNR